MLHRLITLLLIFQLSVGQALAMPQSVAQNPTVPALNSSAWVSSNALIGNDINVDGAVNLTVYTDQMDGTTIQTVAHDLGLGSLQITIAKAAISCLAAEAKGADCHAGALGSLVTDLVTNSGITLGADGQEELGDRIELVAAIAGYFASGGEADNVSATASAARTDYENNCMKDFGMGCNALYKVQHCSGLSDAECDAQRFRELEEGLRDLVDLIPVVGAAVSFHECQDAGGSAAMCGTALIQGVAVDIVLTVAGGIVLKVGGKVIKAFRRGDGVLIDEATGRAVDADDITEMAGVTNRALSRSEFDQRFGGRFNSQAEADAAYDSYLLAKNGDTDIVLGRQTDTAAGGELGMTYLDNPNWTPNVNDAFIQGGIDAGKPFYLGSNPNIANFRAQAEFDVSGNFIGRGDYPETVFLREMRQLRDAGYRLEGDYMLPPN